MAGCGTTTPPLGPVLRRLGAAGLTAAAAALAAEQRARGVAVAALGRRSADGPAVPAGPGARASCPPRSGRGSPPGSSSGTARSTPSSPTPTARRAGGAATPTGRPRSSAPASCPSGRSRTAPAGPRRPSARPGRASRGPRWRRPTWCAPPTADVGRDRDHLRVPAGLGYALAGPRHRSAPPCPASARRPRGRPRRRGAAAARRAGRPRHRRRAPAPRGSPCSPPGESDNAWFEHGLLADALGVPLVAGRGPLAAHRRRRRGRRRRRPDAGRRPLPAARRRAARRLPDARSGSRWTRCWPRPCGPAGSAWPTSRATSWPTTPPRTPGCPR